MSASLFRTGSPDIWLSVDVDLEVELSPGQGSRVGPSLCARIACASHSWQVHIRGLTAELTDRDTSVTQACAIIADEDMGFFVEGTRFVLEEHGLPAGTARIVRLHGFAEIDTPSPEARRIDRGIRAPMRNITVEILHQD